MMLLAPTFKPSACKTVEREMGVSLGDAFARTWRTTRTSFAPCRAYVVHGYDDEASPLGNSRGCGTRP